MPYGGLVPICRDCRRIFEEFEAQFCPYCGAECAPLPSRIDMGDALELGFGRAVLGKVIGEGGMGIVHRGWLYYDPKGQLAGREPHPIAVKLLSPLLKGRDRARQLFLTEANILKRLSHPNIVEFHGLSRQSAQLAIVMELVEGDSLDALIEQRTTAQRQPGTLPCMPMIHAWHYFSQLLGALASIHALGIIHRDVKPSNILVRHDSIAKLTDFGIARLPEEEARQTGGMAPGTGAYMAPEQVRGEEPDARTDLYSASIVLYEMLTGITPFDRGDFNEMMVRAAQLEEVAPPLTHLIPQAPPVMDIFFARALAKDRLHRYSSATELGEALREALGIPDSEGWRAQRELAKKAVAVSRSLPAADPLAATHPSNPPGARVSVSPEQADRLRTDVMTAYRG